MQPITNWTDGYLALRACADGARGMAEADGARWPRTTGDDVIAIASLVDPSMCGLCAKHGELGIVARWREATRDLLAYAVAEPPAEYRANATFWPTLAAVCIYLDSIDGPAPSSARWDALLAELGRASTHRNADAPGYDDVWIQQRNQLAAQRGSDREPNGLIVPRSTNADVLQLAAYWTNALADVRHLHGYDAVAAEWKVMLVEVDAYTKHGKPGDVYIHNTEFWRLSWKVAVQIAVTNEAPTKWEMLKDSVASSVTHLPDTLAEGAHKVGELFTRGAREVGKVVGEAGGGLLSGLGIPVVVIAGLVGLYLLVRPRHEHHAE